ncbi:MAG TPA: hypothetical protein PLX89_03355 [Verrucomicrobiota bacterium]|nr:hypothetical protein [Verrucomicrobiales bacterium]HRI12020.1 hypothetical protein [Verrucomicrobiota bacterium]
MNLRFRCWIFFACALTGSLWAADGPLAPEEPRPSQSDTELRGWLENMVWYHRFTPDEVSAATGLNDAAVATTLTRWQIRADTRPKIPTNEVWLLPYPGGRHPRLGFFDGAIRTQRETKVSVFLPWPDSGYVVVDVPEAIFCNLGLIYLAHTHVPTVWEAQGITLPKREWMRTENSGWESTRTLPNGIAFGTLVTPIGRDAVAVRLWVRNGTEEPLTGMRAQVCAMLGRAVGFNGQTTANKLIEGSTVGVCNQDQRRWILSFWEPLNRAWENPPVPCMHSDPAIPDCPPGETREARGWLWFYEGADVRAEIRRRRDAWLAR